MFAVCLSVIVVVQFVFCYFSTSQCIISDIVYTVSCRAGRVLLFTPLLIKCVVWLYPTGQAGGSQEVKK